MSPAVETADTHPGRRPPAVGWIVASAIAVLVLTSISWFPFDLSCGLAENVPENSNTDNVCKGIESGSWFRIDLAAAVLTTIVGSVVARRLGRVRWLVAGVLLGLSIGGAPWVLFGDPAGNFGGVLDLSSAPKPEFDLTGRGPHGAYRSPGDPRPTVCMEYGIRQGAGVRPVGTTKAPELCLRLRPNAAALELMEYPDDSGASIFDLEDAMNASGIKPYDHVDPFAVKGLQVDEAEWVHRSG